MADDIHDAWQKHHCSKMIFQHEMQHLRPQVQTLCNTELTIAGIK